MWEWGGRLEGRGEITGPATITPTTLTPTTLPLASSESQITATACVLEAKLSIKSVNTDENSPQCTLGHQMTPISCSRRGLPPTADCTIFLSSNRCGVGRARQQQMFTFGTDGCGPVLINKMVLDGAADPHVNLPSRITKIDRTLAPPLDVELLRHRPRRPAASSTSFEDERNGGKGALRFSGWRQRPEEPLKYTEEL